MGSAHAALVQHHQVSVVLAAVGAGLWLRVLRASRLLPIFVYTVVNYVYEPERRLCAECVETSFSSLAPTRAADGRMWPRRPSKWRRRPNRGPVNLWMRNSGRNSPRLRARTRRFEPIAGVEGDLRAAVNRVEVLDKGFVVLHLGRSRLRFGRRWLRTGCRGLGYRTTLRL